MQRNNHAKAAYQQALAEKRGLCLKCGVSAVPSPLAALLRSAIAARGPLTFRDFMAEALYHPEHGYYGSGRAAIGRRGDFFTNVSVGPLFGALLARQFEEMWSRLDRPGQFTIVEQGAHRGDFARDVLAALQTNAPEFFAVVAYRIVESGNAPRAAQAEKLSPFREKVNWSASVPDIGPFSGVFFSNELLDAFPVHAVFWSGEKWHERYVDFRQDRFLFVDGALSIERLSEYLTLLPKVAGQPYAAEVNLAALDWVAQIAGVLAQGYVLTIDYGFPRAALHGPHRPEGTLTGYSQHRQASDVLARPGEIDLTAHVDFTSLTERAEAAGLRLHGFTDQHHFMVGLGGRHFADTVTPTQARDREMRAFKTLMHPDFLGASFKALCLEKGVITHTPLTGFHYGSDPRTALGLR